MARRLEVEIVGDARSLNRALGSAESSTKGLGGHFRNLGRTAAFTAGAAGIGAVAFAVKDVIGDMLAGQKATAQTNAVLRSTGKVAGVTSKDVQDLAGAISMKSGIDDEAIQSGENLLLTFTNIRNEAGAGNDIFNQTTAIMADMSSALGQDASSSAIQLGKALNDPIKGVTALQRVGVSFTQAQRDQIKALVESGHAMDAQKLILRELNKEFGGSAEAAGKTLPGQLSILQMKFENLSESLIQKALPSVREWVTYGTQHIGDVKTALQPTVAYIQQTVIPLLEDFRDRFIAGIRSITGVMQHDVPRNKQLFMDLATVMRALSTVVVPILKGAFFVVQTSLKMTAFEIHAVIVGLAAIDRAIRATAGALQAAGKGAVADFRGSVSALGRALDTVQNLLKWLRDTGASVFTTVWKGIEKPLHALNDGVRALARALGSVVSAFKWIIDNVKKVGGVFSSITGAVGGLAGKLPHGDAIRAAATSAGGAGTTQSSAAAGRQWGVGRQLWDEIAIGQRFGLQVSSGYRPGAHTRRGTLSDHAKHAAVDMSGPASGMAATFRALIGRTEVKQAFYDPLGSIFDGVRSSYREGGHSNHIHIAEYDRGGILPPGLTLALNRTGRNERVISGLSDRPDRSATYVFNFPNYVGSRRELEETIKRAVDDHRSRNGRSLTR